MASERCGSAGSQSGVAVTRRATLPPHSRLENATQCGRRFHPPNSDGISNWQTPGRRGVAVAAPKRRYDAPAKAGSPSHIVAAGLSRGAAVSGEFPPLLTAQGFVGVQVGRVPAPAAYSGPRSRNFTDNTTALDSQSRRPRLHPPLWLSEGLARLASRTWSTTSPSASSPASSRSMRIGTGPSSGGSWTSHRLACSSGLRDRPRRPNRARGSQSRQDGYAAVALAIRGREKGAVGIALQYRQAIRARCRRHHARRLPHSLPPALAAPVPHRSCHPVDARGAREAAVISDLGFRTEGEEVNSESEAKRPFRDPQSAFRSPVPRPLATRRRVRQYGLSNTLDAIYSNAV